MSTTECVAWNALHRLKPLVHRHGAPAPTSGHCSLCAQAAKLDDFVSRKQEACRQQAGSHGWLVTQQRLEQEASDSAAELLDLPRTFPHLPALLLQIPEAPESAGDAHEMENARGLVPGAVSLSLTISELLEAARERGVPLTPATVASIQGHIAALRRELAGSLDLLGLKGRGLTSEIKGHAAAGQGGPAGTPGAGLEERVQALRQALPLADAAVSGALLESAQQLQAAYAESHRRRVTACCEFLQRRSGGGGSDSCGPQPAQSPQGGASGSPGRVLGSSASGSCGSGVPPEEVIVGLEESGEGSDWSIPAAAAAAGWTEEERAAFPRIRQDCLAEAGPTAGRGQVLERLRLRLPHKKAAQLREYWDLSKEAARLRRDVVQMQRGWEDEARSFLAAAKVLLEESSAETLQLAGAAAARVERAVAAVQSAQAVEERQADWAAREAQRAQQRADELAQQDAEREAQRARHERYRERMHVLLAEHREALRAKETEAQALRDAEEAEEAKKAATAAAANQERVAFRRQQAAQRTEAAQEVAQEQERAQRAREAALERLRSQVAPAVERDSQRATAPTESCRAGGGPRRTGGEAAFRQMFGYTTDDVLQDQRFKVYEALRRLNLHSFEYAREAVAAARPAQPPRRDTLTTLQRAQCILGLP